MLALFLRRLSKFCTRSGPANHIGKPFFAIKETCGIIKQIQQSCIVNNFSSAVFALFYAQSYFLPWSFPVVPIDNTTVGRQLSKDQFSISDISAGQQITVFGALKGTC